MSAGQPGRIVLMGGGEFRPNCHEMDSLLLAMIGAAEPRVVILPTAAATENPHMAARNGIEHFGNLGASTSTAMILTREDADEPGMAGSLLAGDIIYLVGGNPGYLVETLRGTGTEHAIRSHLAGGGMVIGSSAGAMVLAEKMASWKLQWREGLGLVPGIGVIPHFEDLAEETLTARRNRLDETITLLAIDTATCCLSDGDGSWQVLGEGRVGVYAGRTGNIYKEGENFRVNV